ncbi:hypothetical protein ACFV85_17240 [Streptomyces niveus]|uniref:hypothetical protein n=1 Tax=Streptomyces niveus TaxID=193462 RepID=UPI00364F9682
MTERIDARLGYSSRYYRRPADRAAPWKAMYVQGNPDVPRGGVIVPVEGDRWLVTLIGQGEHQPPTENRSGSPSPRRCVPVNCPTR